MKISFFFILFLFFSSSLFANNKAFYEGRAKFVKEYIEELKQFRKKDPDYNGAIAESLTGSFFAAFDNNSQDAVDQKAIETCKKNNNQGCKIRFKGFAINPDYNRLAVFDQNNKNLNIGFEDIPTDFMLEHKGINFVYSITDYQGKDFKCSKTNRDNDFIADMIMSQIDIYPQSFLDRAGLKYILICGDLKASGASPEGLAPAHYDQSPGVFMLSVQKIKKQIDAGQPQIIKHIFHHEFYHVIDSTLTKAVVDDDWVRINKFPYSTENLKASVNQVLSDGKGFVSNYAKNNEFEDKAELFAYLITKNKEMRNLLTKDLTLYQKTKLMISRMKQLSSDINSQFWSKLVN